MITGQKYLTIIQALFIGPVVISKGDGKVIFRSKGLKDNDSLNKITEQVIVLAEFRKIDIEGIQFDHQLLVIVF